MLYIAQIEFRCQNNPMSNYCASSIYTIIIWQRAGNIKAVAKSQLIKESL